MGVNKVENPLASDLNYVVDQTRELWEEIRGERLFITGGTGFFGCWLLESFLWANQHLRLEADITVLTRHPDAFASRAPHLAHADNITLLTGNVQDFDFPAGTFSYIIHAATEANSPDKRLTSLKEYGLNISGTSHTLDFASVCHATKFLFTSSGAIYGKQPTEITHLPEDYSGAPATTDPGAAYGQSKRASEFLCAAFAQQSSLLATIARCFAFAGPGLPLDANYAIGNFIRDALHGGPILIRGDGTPYRSYLYSADLTIWLWTILFKGQSGRAYNVGSDQELTIEMLAHLVAKIISPAIPVHVAVKPQHDQAPERYVPSISRARQELGLDVRISLDESIRRMAHFFGR